MLTKAQITNIDYSKNTCTIDIPIFSSAGINQRALYDNAIFAVQPGMYNNFSIGDIVIVSFEDNYLNKPIVLGKLYTTDDIQNVDKNGGLNIGTLNVASKATIPINTALSTTILENTAEISESISQYKTISDIITAINNLSLKINTINAGYSSNTPPSISCIDPCTNIQNAGPKNCGYSYETYDTYYLIKYKENGTLSTEEVSNYMYYMTGQKTIPIITNNNIYNGAFMFTNGTVCYPKYEDSHLKLVRVTTEPFTTETRVREIIEEMGSEVWVEDTITQPPSRFAGRGANVENTETHERLSNNKIEIKDLTKGDD